MLGGTLGRASDGHRVPRHGAPADRRRGVGGMSIRVLLVDDQALVRTGFRMILADEEDIEVVGEAADGRRRSTRPGGSARRRRDGHPDAGHGRRRGDAPARRATGEPTRTGARPDDVRHGRARRRGAAGRRERVPAQGRDARPTSSPRSASWPRGEALIAPSVTRRLLERFATGSPPADDRARTGSARADRARARGPASSSRRGSRTGRSRSGSSSPSRP